MNIYTSLLKKRPFHFTTEMQTICCLQQNRYHGPAPTREKHSPAAFKGSHAQELLCGRQLGTTALWELDDKHKGQQAKEEQKMVLHS